MKEKNKIEKQDLLSYRTNQHDEMLYTSNLSSIHLKDSHNLFHRYKIIRIISRYISKCARVCVFLRFNLSKVLITVWYNRTLYVTVPWMHFICNANGFK